MNLTNVRLILAREVRDQVRDRRTMFMIFVLPVLLYPLMGVSIVQVSQFMLQKPARVLIVGARNLPESPPLFDNGRFAADLFTDPASQKLLDITFAAAESPSVATAKLSPEEQRQRAREEMEDGGFDALVFFPDDFGRGLEAARQSILRRATQGDDSQRPSGEEQAASTTIPGPEIMPNPTKRKAEFTSQLLRSVLRTWSDRIGDANLAASNVPIVAARPFVPTIEETLEDKARNSARLWGQILPLLLVLWAMTGAFYPAVDLCAGEKERGTLETLLSSPAHRSEIVLGKLLTVMLFSMATATLNVVSMGITGIAVEGQFPQLGAPPLMACLWLPLALLPVSALFSALCLAMAAFARSTKEGQYYLMPLILLTLPLVVLSMSPGVELTLGNSLIPVTGLVLLLRTLLEGNVWQGLPLAPPVVAVTLLCCWLAIRWAVDQFNSESVLFRESERLDLGLAMRRLIRDRGPTPTVGAAVACGVLILCIKFFLSLLPLKITGFGGFASAAALGAAVVILPALAMTFLLTASPRKTLLLKLPRWQTVPAAMALAIAFHPLALGLQQLVSQGYPISGTVKAELERIQQILAGAPLWALLLLAALMPAVCEELAFRGFILSGFRHLGHKWRAIVLSAVFFGLTHSILQQSIIASLVGVVIGYVAVQSGSILPGMLFHFIHNSLLMIEMQLTPAVLERAPWLKVLVSATGDGELAYHWPVWIAGVCASVLLAMWFGCQPHEKSAEEALQDAIAREDRPKA